MEALLEVEFEAGFLGGRRGGGFLGGEDGFDGEELDGVEDDVAVGVGVGDGDRAGFAFFEAEDAEGFEELFFRGFLARVEGHGASTPDYHHPGVCKHKNCDHFNNIFKES